MTDIRIQFRRSRSGTSALVRLLGPDIIRFRLLHLPPATTAEEAYDLALSFALARVQGVAICQGRLC